MHAWCSLYIFDFFMLYPSCLFSLQNNKLWSPGPLKEILIALTSTFWHHYSYSISDILVAIASSAQIPRQGHPTVRMESCSYRRVAITAVSFTTIPPGWSKSWIQNVHSTVYFGLFSCTNCHVASIRIHNSTRHFHVMAFSHGQSFLLC